MYKDGVIEAIQHAHGRITADGAYEYTLSDHLGNGRVYLRDKNQNGILEVPYDPYADPEAYTEAIQEQHYYPFGLEMHGNSILSTPDVIKSRFGFNGNEALEETGFSDFNARLYRADLGRFMNVDPLAAAPNQVSISPYAFAWNDPVGLNDPSGLSPDFGCPNLGGSTSGFGFGGFNGGGVSAPNVGGSSGGMSGGSSMVNASGGNPWVQETDEEGNISFMAEAGDSNDTFMEQYEITPKQFIQMMDEACCNGLQVTYEAGETIHTSLKAPFRIDISASDQDIINQLRFMLMYGYAKKKSMNLDHFFNNLNTVSSARRQGESGLDGKVGKAGNIDLRGIMLMGNVKVPVYIPMMAMWENMMVDPNPIDQGGGALINGKPSYNWKYGRSKKPQIFWIGVPRKYLNVSGDFLYNPFNK